MKKVKYLIIAVICALCLVPNLVSAKSDKVTVYMFRGEGCGYCKKAIAYFRELAEDKDYKDKFELKTYEVWNNTNNSKLMAAVADKLGEEVNGVPFIIIGEKTFGGYAESFNSEIEKAIDDNFGSKDYTDVVAKTIKDSNYEEKVEMTTLSDIKEDTTSNETSNTNSSEEKDEESNTGVIIGIACIVIGGLAALIYVSRS